jgi:C-terminal processing protease CtpA/Prc
MNVSKYSLTGRMSNSLIAVALSVVLPLAVRADNVGGLRLETASLDVSQASNREAPASPPEKTMLYGKARKHDALPDATGAHGAPQYQPDDLSATDNQATLAAEKASTAAILYALAAKKLAAGQQLSSNEYRSLGAGCAGYESDRTFFQQIAKVSAVYRGSPADKAGLRKGDKLIDIENDEDAKANPSVPIWGVTTGLAGTPVTLTVLRHGHPVAMTLIRMNIEDIEDPKIRQMWEDVIRNLGYPKDGTFIGPNLNNLHRAASDGPGAS